MTRLADQLATKRLVVFLGTGGVGKTTVSATAALHAAKTGRRTLVLTIDPARRLADSLGVTVGDKPVKVAENLDAMMLDTKKALDALIEKYAPSPDVMKRIFSSRFYEQLSDAFAGSEEFVAMGALHDLYVDGDYDVIVVDTPPSKHAVDFLSVNQKLIRVFESGIVKYLFKPTKFLRLGGGYMTQALARWTSQEYLEEVADFMMSFDEMFLDMESRVRVMHDVITDPRYTSVNLVTAAEDQSVPMAAHLHKEVVNAVGLRVDACVVNRYYPRLKGMDSVRALAEPGDFREGGLNALAEHADASPDAAAAFLDDATMAAGFYDGLARRNERNIERLREAVDADFQLVPALPGSVHDMPGLERVRQHLFEGPRAAQ